MTNDAEKIVSSELSPDEKLVWSGRPRTGIRLSGTDVLLIPFSLVWCGFAVYWETSVLRTGAPDFFPIFGLTFVAFGSYLVFGRFIADAIRRGKTFYELTSGRAIIVSGVFSRHTKSINLASISELSVSERRDRSGTISLGAPSGVNAWAAGMMGPSWPGSARYLPPMFEMIEDARTVYEQIRAQRGK